MNKRQGGSFLSLGGLFSLALSVLKFLISVPVKIFSFIGPRIFGGIIGRWRKSKKNENVNKPVAEKKSEINQEPAQKNMLDALGMSGSSVAEASVAEASVAEDNDKEEQDIDAREEEGGVDFASLLEKDPPPQMPPPPEGSEEPEESEEKEAGMMELLKAFGDRGGAPEDQRPDDDGGIKIPSAGTPGRGTGMGGVGR